ncbi:MAG: YicC family protein [Acidobacteria bacterium]|nr:YicC family protein [Acidobacteriota bacterium]
MIKNTESPAEPIQGEKPGQNNAPSQLRSMTGFGSATTQHEGLSLTAMLRSVNHRHMDLRVHLPEWLLPLENKVRGMVQARNARGHMDLRVTAESTGGTGVSVDEELVARYMETFERLGALYRISRQTDAATLLQLPGVVTRKDVSGGVELNSAIEAIFLSTVERAVESWDQMRAQEGTALATDMRERLATLRELVVRMESDMPELLRHAQTRLIDRLKALLAQAAETAGPAAIDPTRLAQEASLLADRTDVSEEVVRLKAHVEHFQEILASAPDAGRKLDFLLQEMNRETNTLLAKIASLGQVSLNMTGHGLEAKAEIEKIREQIQNLQ